MGKVLTTASEVTCGHDPTGPIVTEGSNKLTVSGDGVLTAAGVKDKSIDPTACGLTPNQGPPVTTRCKKVQSVTAGPAKLTVVGEAVLLEETVAGTTDGMLAGVTPQLLLRATAKQSRLTAV